MTDNIAQATDSVSQDRPFTATQAHVDRIAAKRQMLEDAQLAAEAQLLTSIAREVQFGRLALPELIDVYYDFRFSAGEIAGWTKRWDEAVPVKSALIVGAMRSMVDRAPAPEPAAGWFGSFPFGEDEYVPGRDINTVYVLFDADNVPCYVGSTKYLRHRIKQHHKDGKQFTSWQARSCATRAGAYALERRWLAEHMPYLNKRAS